MYRLLFIIITHTPHKYNILYTYIGNVLCTLSELSQRYIVIYLYIKYTYYTHTHIIVPIYIFNVVYMYYVYCGCCNVITASKVFETGSWECAQGKQYYNIYNTLIIIILTGRDATNQTVIHRVNCSPRAPMYLCVVIISWYTHTTGVVNTYIFITI